MKHLKAKKRRKIVELLKSGNFTVSYSDIGICCIYEGKYEHDNLPEIPFHEFSCEMNGYMPVEMMLFIEALNGKADVIETIWEINAAS